MHHSLTNNQVSKVTIIIINMFRFHLQVSSVVVFYVLVNCVLAAPQHENKLTRDGDDDDDMYYDDATTVSPSCGCVCGLQNQKQRIVGGNVTHPNEFPWVVALERRGKFYCGATLVTRKHIITAAHCVDGFNLKEIRVYLGVHNRLQLTKKGTLVRNIKTSKVHPSFDIFSFDNDIAVIELDSEVEFSEMVRPVCLPSDVATSHIGKQAIVAGWGRMGEKSTTAVELMKVDVPVMSMEACRASGYGAKRITDNMICAGYSEGKKDGCQGDSGGPMHISVGRSTIELLGVVSWGRGCARPNFPGVYTRVSNYLPWITGLLNEECLCARPE